MNFSRGGGEAPTYRHCCMRVQDRAQSPWHPASFVSHTVYTRPLGAGRTWQIGGQWLGVAGCRGGLSWSRDLRAAPPTVPSRAQPPTARNPHTRARTWQILLLGAVPVIKSSIAHRGCTVIPETHGTCSRCPELNHAHSHTCTPSCPSAQPRDLFLTMRSHNTFRRLPRPALPFLQLIPLPPEVAPFHSHPLL